MAWVWQVRGRDGMTGFEFEHLCFNVPVKTRHPAAPYVEDYYGQRELRMGTAERSQLAGGGE